MEPIEFDPSHVTIKDLRDAIVDSDFGRKFLQTHGRSRIAGALRVRDEAVARAQKKQQRIDELVNELAVKNREIERLKAASPAPVGWDAITLTNYAQNTGQKTTAVLMALLGAGFTGLHVNSPLNREHIFALANASSRREAAE